MDMYFLRKIFSYMPLFNITDDEEFGDIEKDSKFLRFSLLAINIGTYNLYFITYKKGTFELLKIVRISDVFKLPDISEASNKADIFENSIRNDNDKIETFNEALVFKIGEENERINISLNKANIYNAVLFVLIPLLIPCFQNIQLIFKNVLLLILSIFVIKGFIGSLLLALHIFSVKSIISFKFADIKKSDNPKIELSVGYYLRWYSAQREANYFVSLVKNLQKSMIIFLILFCVFFVAYNFVNSNKVAINSADISSNIINNSSTVEVKFNEGQSTINDKNNNSLRQLQVYLQNSGYCDIIIVKDKCLDFRDQSLYTERVNLLTSYLKLLNKNRNDILILDSNRIIKKLPKSIKIVFVGR
ncbi:hypothetical protein [Ruminiclostridium cellobioparum]|uniref:hypothetical protein n=1 Tax=Ruminiclostridium cellobioparum TaxID=29355 RepID=UPI0028AA3E72|nr:hypothetical protein [Ruminiclostridium cellobioparum]